MIKTYTASPTRITRDSIDMNRLGEGSGVQRYAAGLYFGRPSTVGHYLEQYKKTTFCDAKIVCNGVEVNPSTPAYKILQYLIRKGDKASVDDAYIHFKDQPDVEKEAIDFIIGGEDIDYTAEFGICHEVKLKGINESDLLDWDDVPTQETLTDWAYTITDELGFLSEKLKNLETDELDISLTGNLREDIVTIFDAVHLDASENKFDHYVDETALFELFEAKTFNNSSYNEQEIDAYNILEDNYPIINKLHNITHQYVNLDNTMTHGDFYECALSLFSEDEKEAKIKASDFFSKKLYIPGFSCKSMYGNEGSREFVIMDEQILKDSYFSEISHDELAFQIEEESNALEESFDNNFGYENSYGYTPRY